MSKWSLSSPAKRSLITLFLLIGITGSFLAIYYLIYLPQVRSEYNLRIFRVLHEISSNFRDRVTNYGKVLNNKYANRDSRVSDSFITQKNDNTTFLLDTQKLKNRFQSSFKG